MLTPADILGPAGRITARLPNYEDRPQQLAMAEAVAKAIAEKRHLVAEAGTGVGKSFAYLVPAIIAAAGADQSPGAATAPRRRVVVATHTISLQEQLLGKDIPLLRSVIPHEFTAVLAKGRGNYLSLRRMNAAADRASSLFQDESEFAQLREIVAWSRDTGDGSLSDISISPHSHVWDEVASDSANCMGRNCPTYDACFYYRARRRLQNANLIIVNHALLFADLALRAEGASILPDYDVAILDEAHTVEAVASDHLGVAISSGQVEFLLNRLYNDRTNKGLLVHHRLREAQQEVESCRFAAQDFFDNMHERVDGSSKASLRVEGPEAMPNPLSPRLAHLSRLLKTHGAALPDEEKQDFTSAAERLQAIASEIEAWRMRQYRDSVYWIDATRNRRGYRRTTLAAAPLDVGPALREHLFEKVDTVILTSATLAVGGERQFEFFRRRIGLANADEMRLGSPFNFREQAELVLVSEMPDPVSQTREFEARSMELVRYFVEQSDGHAFVLFTNYEALRRSAADIGPWLTAHSYTLYSQADGVPRSQLLEQFKLQPRGVLFGTDSFWQGVDVPGDALQTVVITKLPFSVPDKPLTAARLDSIRASGGNPFRDYQLPEAAIKLKQGFGRLIRTRQDRGVVAILDPRVLTKPYGRTFLDSLPDCKRTVISAASVAGQER